MIDMNELEKAIAEITEIAKGFGLDPFPMRYEICPPEIIYTFGAYGMPTRFSHWSFGKAFHRMKLQYDLGLSKIYELVINNNPSYAFLLEGNTFTQNKLIVAHVLAHSDFFKNNIRFMNTPRDMVESMARTADRIRHYEKEYGRQEVEEFIDSVLAIQEHIDPSLFKKKDRERKIDEKPKPKKTSEYDDLWKIDKTNETALVKTDEEQKFPPFPEKDIVLFCEEYSRVLKDWQRDIMTMLREEMLYFWPQIETKIMNEGWASYWHMRILRELDLNEEETIEFAKLNAGVVQPSRTSINPYYLGVKIFEDIEKRWDHPTKEEQEQLGRKPGEGRKKIFEVREIDADISFLRNYLTKKLVNDLDLYLYQKRGNEWVIVEKDWEKVRDQLVQTKVNGGFPYIVVENGDYLKNGELYLKHHYEGIELDILYLEKTLPHVYKLWGRTVHLETFVENRPVLFSYDGKKTFRKFL
ncbi:SpoVR family protein [Tepidibacillus infernus]|uniref:SpoVR family protein n=1 Tax=Tepidibacillus TaxID=1494427 RepID=UPI0008537DA4|nr:SpoVR family protein [Tepidibacillus sp. HK-1]GBF11735.1 spoVR family protein [Tepidibacillus sp. HK-1]